MEATTLDGRHTVPASATQTVSHAKQLEQRGRIKWPKAKERDEWNKLDRDVSGILEHALRGIVEDKLKVLSNICFLECKEWEVHRGAPMQQTTATQELEESDPGADPVSQKEAE